MKILLFANTDWYLYNFRLPLARCLREQGNEVVLMSPSGEYSSRLEQAGFHWIPFDFEVDGMNPMRELGVIISLVRLYRKEQPEIVHHFTVKCVLYGSLAARIVGVRGIINAVTGLGYLFIGRGLKASLLRQIAIALYRIALHNTQVIFQNPDDQEAFISLGLAGSQQCILIRSSGIDMQRFQVTPEPDGIPMVLLAGRMLWDKGVGEFIDAARILLQEGVKARFVLVGGGYPGNPASISDDQLKLWQSEGGVEWWGWREDMADVYARSSVVCLPSYREGLPRSLAEAAACGRPLVATDVPGCREIVRGGENGLLVPVRNASALAAALRSLLSDPELRHRMGARSREIALASVSEEHVIGETLKVYNSFDLR
jgi:glycosyltransferase involved in cell wall biosynthesis